MVDSDVRYLIPFCTTPRQREIVEAVSESGGQRAAARKLGVDSKNVWRTINALKLKAESTDTSTLWKFEDENGNKILQWVKAKGDKQKEQEATRAAFEAMSMDIPRLPAISEPVPPTEASLLNQYTITDYHLGMLSWGEETGEDWNLGISEDTLLKWMERAISLSPPAKCGILAQLGDFLHYDSLDPLTPANKHILGTDSRIQKIIRSAVYLLRRMIDMMVMKHDTVIVFNLEGNHDPVLSAAIREFLPILYENEPRVTVVNSPSVYQSYRWGNTGLYYHHGHKANIKNIDRVFVANFKETFSNCEYNYGHMGHYHTDEIMETALMRLERHRTLIAPDAYASRGGYISMRDAKVITYHNVYGEVGRTVIPIKMINGDEP